MNITHQRLVELLAYRPETGEFIWRVSRGKASAGSVAGCVRSDGYRRLKIDGKDYYAQRLAWFYVTGEWPPEEVDHRDRDRDNNIWDNLRLADTSEQGCNRDSGAERRGVMYDAERERWSASVYKNRKRVYFQRFHTFEAASAARDREAAAHHGEFAT